LTQAETNLYRKKGKGCQFCHEVQAGDGLPAIVPTKIPTRWLPMSAFDHRSHRALECVACHGGAPKSVDTADVLMPKIETCRECHRPGGGALSGCVECHLYHDRAKERPPGGALSVPEFVTGRSRAAPPPAAKPP
jgi:hypothetical protein